MKMAKVSEFQLLRCENGIYLGKPLKNGNISKDARKITDEEIILLFREYLENYCLKNGTNLLEIQKNGKVYIEAKLHLCNS